LRELGRRYGAGRTASGFTGTPADVADRMAAWLDAGACDGFMIQTPWMPGGLDDFVRLAVPELQRRGLFRMEYDGTTLREHLRFARPENVQGS
jgi:alkanesulfonate monooxygenase SsuD/methylene tetrahydromethanopterin reductase-like flavin-dependent oxidoreductase (luciferase family)